MKALLKLWALEFVVMLVILGVLALAQKWDEADTQRVRISMMRGA